MNSNLKCKDYFIFKFRYYADKKMLNRWHADRGLQEPVNIPILQQHYDRANLSIDFLFNLAEKVTGKNKKEWYSKYMFSTIDCILEEMQETHGIFRWEFSEGYHTYLIPIRHVEIIEWVKPQIKYPHKILKRSSFGYIPTDENTNYHRISSENNTKSFKHKIFIAENTRKVLFEKTEK